METGKQITETIIALERGALERWGKGDPSGCLEISAPEVSYFDPFIEKRIDGLDALAEYYESLRGKIRIDRFELLNPRVDIFGEIAVLTYNYVSYGGNDRFPWNCTEVYRRYDDRNWRIVQTHWSIPKSR